MKKNGFTLVELLAIIILIAVIAGISVTSIMGVNNKTKEKLLENKLELIEGAAILYVNKNNNDITTSSIMNSRKKYHPGDQKVYPCVSIPASYLVPDFVDADASSTCLSTSEASGEGCITNPADNNSYLDNVDVILYYKNNRVYAKADINNKYITENGREYSNCYLYGDVNNDNAVNTLDASYLVQQCLLKIVEDPFCTLQRHDLNLDGVTDCYDLCIAKEYALSVIDHLPYLETVSSCSACSHQSGDCSQCINN